MFSVTSTKENIPDLKHAGFKSNENMSEHNPYNNNVTHKALDNKDNDAQLMMQEDQIQQIINTNISDQPATHEDYSIRQKVHRDHYNHLISQSGNTHNQSIYKNSPGHDQPIMDNSFKPMRETLFDKSSHHQQMYHADNTEMIVKGYSYEPTVLKYNNNHLRPEEEYQNQLLTQELNSDQQSVNTAESHQQMFQKSISDQQMFHENSSDQQIFDENSSDRQMFHENSNGQQMSQVNNSDQQMAHNEFSFNPIMHEDNDNQPLSQEEYHTTQKYMESAQTNKVK